MSDDLSLDGYSGFLMDSVDRHRQHPAFIPNTPIYTPLSEKLNHLQEYGLLTNAERNGLYVLFYDETPRMDLTVFTEHLQMAGATTHLVTLPTNKILKDRDLASAIVGRKLLRGETTARTLKKIEETHYAHVVLIDNAEYLSRSTIVWLVTVARELSRMMFLVIRDKDLFYERLGDGDGRGWILGRMEFVHSEDISNVPEGQ